MRTPLLLAAVNLVALGSLTAPVVTVLPLRVEALVPEAGRTGALALTLAAGSIAAVVANPVFGILSDRTRGGWARWGRRRPWMLAGVLAGLAGTLLLATAPDLRLLVAGWVVAQAAYNATFAAASAFLADVLAEGDRAPASGVFAAATFLGTVPPLALAVVLPDDILLSLLLMPVAAIVVVGAVCAVVREPSPASLGATPGAERTPLLGAGRPPGFAALWVQRLLSQLATSLVLTFTLYLVMDRLRTTTGEATAVTAATTVLGGACLVVSALACGVLAARRGDYGPFLAFSFAGLAAAAVLRAIAGDLVALCLSAALGGLAMGAGAAAGLALALRIIPRSASGRFLGVLNVAETIPQVVAPPLAALLVTLGGPDPVSGGDNYAVLYGTAAVLSLAAAALMPMLRGSLRRPAARTG
jgi:MFS family permease